jgi:hypothetical protein
MIDPPTLPANGGAAAAILACGFGCCALGILALAAALNFYHPAGPLSGVTTVAIALWLLLWAVLGNRWKNKTVAFRKVSASAFVLLALGLLLTFPPFGDLLLGR